VLPDLAHRITCIRVTVRKQLQIHGAHGGSLECYKVCIDSPHSNVPRKQLLCYRYIKQDKALRLRRHKYAADHDLLPSTVGSCSSAPVEQCYFGRHTPQRVRCLTASLAQTRMGCTHMSCWCRRSWQQELAQALAGACWRPVSLHSKRGPTAQLPRVPWVG